MDVVIRGKTFRVALRRKKKRKRENGRRASIFRPWHSIAILRLRFYFFLIILIKDKISSIDKIESWSSVSKWSFINSDRQVGHSNDSTKIITFSFPQRGQKYFFLLIFAQNHFFMVCFNWFLKAYKEKSFFLMEFTLDFRKNLFFFK